MEIEFHSVTKRYGAKVILKSFSGNFGPGIYWLRGDNGSGKSTMLRLLGQIDSEYDGEIKYRYFPTDDVNHFRSFLFDSPQAYPFFRGRELIEFVSRIRRMDPAKYVNLYREGFSLDEIMSLRFNEMSLGQKKKLFATVTLIEECPLWILDEPTNGIDRRAIDRIEVAIRDHSRNGIVFLAEHNEAFCTRLDPTVVHLPKTLE